MQTFPIREAADVLGVIPRLIGFHPENSFVFMSVNDDGRALCGRTDVNYNGHPPTGDTFANIAHQVALSTHNNGGSTLFVAVYHDDLDTAVRYLGQVLEALPESLTALAAIATAGGLYRSMLDPDDSPQPVPTTFGEAEAVLAGLNALPSRDALAATLTAAPDTPDLLNAMDDATSAADNMSTSDRAAELVYGTHHAALVHDDATTDKPDPHRLAALAASIPARDFYLATLTPENTKAHAIYWAHVVTLTPISHAAAALGLAGLTGYLSGNGAAALITADQITEHHPDYTLGPLLLDICSGAIPPPMLFNCLTEALEASSA